MSYDVVVAGAGPVGLFLACELRLAGISVLVLERMADLRSPLKCDWMGMRGLNFPSVEAFYRRGLLDAVRSSSLGWVNPNRPEMEIGAADRPKSTPAPRFAGHFAGIMLDPDKIDFSRQKYTIAGPSASGGLINLESIEFLLSEHATQMGVELRRGVAVTGFVDHGDAGLTVVAGEQSFRTQWLIGCDGGRSTVRKAAGFAFEGTEPELTGYTAWVEFADPEKLRPGFNLTATGMYVNTAGTGRIGVVEFDGGAFDRTAAITRERLQEVLRHVSGTDVTITVVHAASTYTDRARQATTYRKGRVLLAGDAAHVHSPFGGQGLNTGLGDAMNLGWKLAATVQGWGPDHLLDSYTEERHPVGAWALNWTRAQVAVMRPEAHARAMAAIVRDLMDTREGTTYFAEKISGIGLRYNLGGGHPLIGRSTPDFEFEDGTRLGELLHAGKALLLDFAGSEELHRTSESWDGRLMYVSVKVKDSKGATAVFIRPDGFVAWAAESEPSPADAKTAITHWLGNPAAGWKAGAKTG